MLKTDTDRKSVGGSISKEQLNRSPYIMQYKVFEDRLKNRRIKPKHVSMVVRNQVKQDQENEQKNLRQTENMLKNWAHLPNFFQGGEGRQLEVLANNQSNIMRTFKHKIHELKCLQVRDSQQSLQKPQSNKLDKISIRSHPTHSRLHSESIYNSKLTEVRDNKVTLPMTFLNYKKDKRLALRALV